MSSSDNRNKQSKQRPSFQLIQGLRGLASLWVVLFHIEAGNYISDFTAAVPQTITYALFKWGSAGVAVFFVLSGFVIAHSLSDKQIDGTGFLRFVARRSLRLDPPYWAAIILSIAVAAIVALVNNITVKIPSVQTLLYHLLYLQQIFKAPEINTVFWTLTYEIQFYLLLAAAELIVTIGVKNGAAIRVMRFIVMLPLMSLAFFSAWYGSNFEQHRFFIDLWHGFFLGVLAYSSGYRGTSPAPLLALILITTLSSITQPSIFGIPSAITALALFIASRNGYLLHGLGAKSFRFLGQISYSLYLIHIPVMIIGFGAWGRIAGRGLAEDSTGLLVIGALIIGSAWIFWWLIERPSHKLAVELFAEKQKSPSSVLSVPS